MFQTLSPRLANGGAEHKNNMNAKKERELVPKKCILVMRFSVMVVTYGFA